MNVLTHASDKTLMDTSPSQVRLFSTAQHSLVQVLETVLEGRPGSD